MKRLFTLALILIAFTGFVSAQTLKVGYTDHELIIAQMPELEGILSQLQADVQAGELEYQNLGQTFQAALEDYQRKQPLLSAEARQAKEQELQGMQQQLQIFANEKQQEIAAKEAQLLSPIYERVTNAINAVSEEGSYDLILRMKAGNEQLILFAGPRVRNITIDVMRKLGLEIPEGAEEAASN